MKKAYWRIGEPSVWGTGAALSITLLIAATLLVVILVNGLGVFWPSELVQVNLKDGSILLGEVIKREQIPHEDDHRLQFKIANRDLYGLDFRWVDESDITSQDRPQDALVLERQEYGNFFGYLDSLTSGDLVTESVPKGIGRLQAALAEIELRHQDVMQISDNLSAVSYELEDIRRKLIKAEYQGTRQDAPMVKELLRDQAVLQDDFSNLLEQQVALEKELRAYKATLHDASGQSKIVDLLDIVKVYQPNRMTFVNKVGFYAGNIYELLFTYPRESNTEGGLFPAIYGTVMLIFIMSLLTISRFRRILTGNSKF